MSVPETPVSTQVPITFPWLHPVVRPILLTVSFSIGTRVSLVIRNRPLTLAEFTAVGRAIIPRVNVTDGPDGCAMRANALSL